MMVIIRALNLMKMSISWDLRYESSWWICYTCI